MKFVLGLMSALITLAATTAQAEEYRIDLRDQEFGPRSTLDLRRLVEDYTRRDTRNEDLVAVSILAKGEVDSWIQLLINRRPTNQAILPGNPRDYRFPAHFTFRDLTLASTSTDDTYATWDLAFQVRTTIREVRISTRSRGGWGPGPGDRRDDRWGPPGRDDRRDDRWGPPGRDDRRDDRWGPPGRDDRRDDRWGPPGRDNRRDDRGPGPGPGPRPPEPAPEQFVDVTCESQGYNPQACPIGRSPTRVDMIQQFSSGRGQCSIGGTVQILNDGIRVTNGCRGRFRVYFR